MFVTFLPIEYRDTAGYLTTDRTRDLWAACMALGCAAVNPHSHGGVTAALKNTNNSYDIACTLNRLEIIGAKLGFVSEVGAIGFERIGLGQYLYAALRETPTVLWTPFHTNANQTAAEQIGDLSASDWFMPTTEREAGSTIAAYETACLTESHDWRLASVAVRVCLNDFRVTPQNLPLSEALALADLRNPVVFEASLSVHGLIEGETTEAWHRVGSCYFDGYEKAASFAKEITSQSRAPMLVVAPTMKQFLLINHLEGLAGNWAMSKGLVLPIHTATEYQQMRTPLCRKQPDNSLEIPIQPDEPERLYSSDDSLEGVRI